MNDAKMTAVFGCRGMGKSNLVKHLVKSWDRVLMFDPQGEYAYLPGFQSVAWSDLPAAVQAEKFKLSYKPRKGSHPAALHGISDLLLTIREPYADWMARGRPGQPPMPQMLFGVEEMSTSYPSEKLPADLWGMTEMSERGRHAGIEVIGTTQRPATISTKFLGNCEERMILRLDLVIDVDAVCKYIGAEYRDQIRQLQRGQYIHYRNGQAEVKIAENP